MAIDEHKLTRELEAMRRLIADDPEVFARFDLDGNGVIEGAEWDAVVRLVVARLEREAAELDYARRTFDELDAKGFAASDAADVESLRAQLTAAADGPAVASKIFQQELRSNRFAEERAAAAGLTGAITDRRELIFEGVGELMEPTSFRVLDAQKKELGRIARPPHEKGFRALVTTPSVVQVHDFLGGSRISFDFRSAGVHSITVRDGDEVVAVASSRFSPMSLIRAEYRIESPGSGEALVLRQGLLRRWTWDIAQNAAVIGRVDLQWSFLLSFFTDGSFRIELQRAIPPALYWGLIATSLDAHLLMKDD